MKNYRRLFIILFAMLLAVIMNSSVQAQEWSSEQQAVWKNVNAYWDAFAGGNVNNMLSYYHDSYRGWGFNEPLPGTKSETQKGLKYFLQNNSIVMYNIKPVAINVLDDIAVVHYYYDMTFKSTEGEEQNTSGRWTDVLMKQGNKWLLIGDSGGNTAN
ncbi:MAG: nuclear transport factor 2 family protein [Calditrichia bacterium]